MVDSKKICLIAKTFPFNKKGKSKRIAEQVQILLDVFGGTLVEGGEE